MSEKEKLFNKKEKIIFIICLCLTCLIFTPFLFGHYAGDTYNIEALGYSNYALNYNLKDGRPFIALFNVLMDKINISINAYVVLTLFMALVVSNVSVIFLRKVIKKYKNIENLKQEILITGISFCLIFNFMYIDCLNFAEAPFIALSELLFIISAYVLCNDNQKGGFLKSIILSCLAILCYQSSMCMFFAMLFLFSILKNKNNVKQILIDLLKGGVITIVVLLINFIVIKLAGYIFSLNQDRVKINGLIILRNIKIIFYNCFEVLKNSCNLFPESLFIYFIFAITIIIVVYAIVTKKEDTFIYKYFLVLIISIISSFVLNIISSSSFMGGRTRLSIGATLGIIFLFLYIESDIFTGSWKLIKYIVISFVGVYILVNIINYENLMIAQKKMNLLEQHEMQDIKETIYKYECENKIEIKEIVKVLYLNQQEKQYYNGLPKNPFTRFGSTFFGICR